MGLWGSTLRPRGVFIVSVFPYVELLSRSLSSVRIEYTIVYQSHKNGEGFKINKEKFRLVLYMYMYTDRRLLLLVPLNANIQNGEMDS